jgi:porin
VELSHLLVESAVVRGKGLGAYAKAAIADGNPNPIKRSFVGGVAGHAVVPGRPLDCFGVGYFFYDFSDELQDAVAPVGSFKDEQGIEADGVYVPVPWLRLSANLQRVNPANGANPAVWLGGVRARLEF